jgi:hypothetical protein
LTAADVGAIPAPTTYTLTISTITDAGYDSANPYVFGSNGENYLYLAQPTVGGTRIFVQIPATLGNAAYTIQFIGNGGEFNPLIGLAPEFTVYAGWESSADWAGAPVCRMSNQSGSLARFNIGDVPTAISKDGNWLEYESYFLDGGADDNDGYKVRYTLNAAEYSRLGYTEAWFTGTDLPSVHDFGTEVPLDLDFYLQSNGDVYQLQSAVWTLMGNIPTNGYAPLYHNHQAGIERDEITDLFPEITDNSATSRTEGYLLEQWRQYKIVTRATVDFTTCGAANNTAGTYFICTSAVITLGAGDEVTEATIDIATGKAWMYDETDMDSLTLHTIDATAAPLTFIPNEANYVCADRDTNTWVVLNSVSPLGASFDYTRFVPYFVANFRTNSTAAHNQLIVLQAHGEVEAIHAAKFACGRYDVATGALRSIGCTDTTLALTLSGGDVFAAYYKYTLPALSATTRQFNCLWLGGSNWSYTTNTNPVLVNTSYNQSGSMTALTAGYYACLYMWRGVEDDDHVYTYYSQAQYETLALAQASAPPTSVPPLASGHGVFVGRIIFQQGQTTSFLSESAFNTIFAASTPITVHNDLAGLNLGEYIHLTSSEKGVYVGPSAPPTPPDGYLWADTSATTLTSTPNAIDWENPIAINTATTLTLGKHHVISDLSSPADYTVTLPAVSGNGGKMVSVEIAASTTKLITVDADGSETIAGNANQIMWAKENIILKCDGSQWSFVVKNLIPMSFDVFNSANQSTLTLAQYNQANLAGVVSDPGGMLSSNTVVIKRPALWSISATGGHTTTATPLTRGILKVYLNGANIGAICDLFPNSGVGVGTMGTSGATQLTLAAADYLSLYLYTTAASGTCSIQGAASGSLTTLKGVEIL